MVIFAGIYNHSYEKALFNTYHNAPLRRVVWRAEEWQ